MPIITRSRGPGGRCAAEKLGAVKLAELVYRHQIVPALTRGAEVMDQIFG